MQQVDIYLCLVQARTRQLVQEKYDKIAAGYAETLADINSTLDQMASAST